MTSKTKRGSQSLASKHLKNHKKCETAASRDSPHLSPAASANKFTVFSTCSSSTSAKFTQSAFSAYARESPKKYLKVSQKQGISHAAKIHDSSSSKSCDSGIRPQRQVASSEIEDGEILSDDSENSIEIIESNLSSERKQLWEVLDNNSDIKSESKDDSDHQDVWDVLDTSSDELNSLKQDNILKRRYLAKKLTMENKSHSVIDSVEAIPLPNNSCRNQKHKHSPQPPSTKALKPPPLPPLPPVEAVRPPPPIDNPPLQDMEYPELSQEAHESLLKLNGIRVWNQTSLGRSYSSGEQEFSSHDLPFRILSYNVLAQNLLEFHPFLYKNKSPDVLEWNYRWKGIQREVRTLDPDIVCLQEVQFKNPPHMLEYYLPFFSRHGYKPVRKARTGDKEDGCAIFYKSKKFQLEEQCGVEYYRGGIPLLDRDNIGLICRFVPILEGSSEETSVRLVVGTTHLLYNQRRTDIKMAQATIFLAELDRMSLTSEGHYHPTIITGDLNLRPTCGTYRLLTSGHVNYAGKKDDSNLIFPQQLLPDHLGLTDTCQWHQMLDPGAASYGSGSFSHQFNFSSAYKHGQESLGEVTTYHDNWVTVDYIMHSRPSQGTEGPLKLLSRLTLPTGPEISSLEGIPSQICPSDHLPLAVNFVLQTDNSEIHHRSSGQQTYDLRNEIHHNSSEQQTKPNHIAQCISSQSQTDHHHGSTAPPYSSEQEVQPLEEYLSWKAIEDLKRLEKGRGWQRVRTHQMDRGDLGIRLLSYNVLAQNLLTQHRELYRGKKRFLLDWKYRWDGIQREVVQINPDIVCLQEVQFKNPNHFLEYFKPFFSSLGYKYVMKSRTGGKEDGCAIFYKTNKLSLDQVKAVEYFKQGVKVLDRDNVGLICRFVSKGSSEASSKLVVATTHLLFNKKRDDVRVAQACVLLAELELMSQETLGEKYPCIVTGDMNLQPFNVVYQLLTTGSLESSGGRLSISQLKEQLGVNDKCQWDQQETKTKTNKLEHNFQFQSVYDHGNYFGNPWDREVTTFQDKWLTVDYILYSNGSRSEDGSLKLVGCMPLPCGPQIASVGGLPSEICPSDHLPLAADFVWKPETSIGKNELESGGKKK